MKAKRALSLIVLCFGMLLLMAGVAYAAPVKWDPASGGNEHFYEDVTAGGIGWAACRNQAVLRTFDVGGTTYRGHLVTITSAEEQAFLVSTFNMASYSTPRYWAGGWLYQGAWRWVTGEPWSYTCWWPGEPSGDGEDVLELWSGARGGAWNDNTSSSTYFTHYVAEYEVDKSPTITAAQSSVLVIEGTTATMGGNWNDDAPVEVQTITASRGTVAKGPGWWSWSYPTTEGPLSDTVTITIDDGVNPSESCSFSLTVRPATPTGPVRWDGNGHLYEAVALAGGSGWDYSRTQAASRTFTDANGITYRGHLVTISSAEEQNFLADRLNMAYGYLPHYWAGGYRSGSAWYWVTGEPWAYTCWYGSEPSNSYGREDVLELWPNPRNGAWNDNWRYETYITHYMVEYELPTIASSASSVPVNEGTTATMSGTWTDGDLITSRTFTADIGSVTTSGRTWSWSYPTSDGPAQSQTVTVTMSDGSASTSCDFALTVNNVAPSVGTITGPGVTVGVGAPVSVSAPFTDPGTLDTRSATWDWGDGNTSSGTVAGTTGSGTVTGSHTYSSPGTYTITLTVTDKDGASGSNIYTQQVNTPPTIASDATSVTVNEGETATMSGTWSDDGAFASQSFSVNVGTVTGAAGGAWSWSYETTDGPAQSQTVTVTMSDGLASTSCSFALTVNNIAPSIDLVTGPMGRVEVGASIVMSATFTDPGTLDTRSAMWDWGDGNTSSGTVSGTTGSGTVTGSHTYSSPGTYTISLTVTDKDGGSDTHTYSQHINAPPTIASDAPSLTVSEGTTATMTGTWSDDDAFASLNFSVNVGTVTGAAGGAWSWSYETTDGPAQSQTVTVTASDSSVASTCEFLLTVNNVSPVVGTITGPVAPVAVNTPVAMSAAFTDAGILDTHEAMWDWGDSSTSEATLSEDAGAGMATGTHVYTEPGVYTVGIAVTDDDRGMGTGMYTEYVVIYDASAGFATGGGWIDSPKGAFVADPTLGGKATFEFVVKYKRGAVAPEGTTKFRFGTGNLSFECTSYEWMVVAGSKVQFKGTGTINGVGKYKFILSAIDNGKGETDTFRIKIMTAGGGLVYDNLINAPDTADPTTAPGGGNIVVHR